MIQDLAWTIVHLNPSKDAEPVELAPKRRGISADAAFYLQAQLSRLWGTYPRRRKDGSRTLLYCTAAGKVFCSFTPGFELRGSVTVQVLSGHTSPKGYVDSSNEHREETSTCVGRTRSRLSISFSLAAPIVFGSHLSMLSRPRNVSQRMRIIYIAHVSSSQWHHET